MENTKKRILITGKNSYVGTSFKKWVEQWPDQYEVDMISVRGEEWREYDFSSYDSVLHVAGIAHVSTDPEMEELYYKVNRDLTIEVAKKAKADGVGQFIFMSSIIVYGPDSKIGDTKLITLKTKPSPSDFYGKSKLQAEEEIQFLSSQKFKGVIIRTPMVYGPNCNGNFRVLLNFAKKTFVFPDIKNLRSMIFIDNLSHFLKAIIDNKERGYFYPQNNTYVCTTDLVKEISVLTGKKVLFTKKFNYAFKLFSKKNKTVNKVFGNKAYDMAISKYKYDYSIVGFNESIKKSLLNK